MKLLLLVVALIVGGSFIGCMKVKDENELLGKYRADLPSGAVEWLELQPKGQCAQEIRLSDGTTYKTQGQWQYDAHTKYLTLRGTRVALSPTREINPKIAQIPPGTTGSLPVSRSLTGSVTIMLHQDIDYRKQ